MRLEQINDSIIGRKVKGIENGYSVTGTIIGIIEDEYCKGVRIKLDTPLTCWSGDYGTESWEETEYRSTGRKSDGWGNIEKTEFLDGVESLENYRPKRPHITSWEEYQDIARKLHLYDSTKEHIISVRDEVVRYFSQLLARQKTYREVYDCTQALLSVTAVVDDFKHKMGIETD